MFKAELSALQLLQAVWARDRGFKVLSVPLNVGLLGFRDGKLECLVFLHALNS